MKKGFTLIELLIVVALMTTLALLAFPAVINVLDSSEKRALIVEARELYDIAKNENLTEELLKKDNIYCYSDSGADNELEFFEKEDYFYDVIIENNEIVNLRLSTPRFYINIENSEGIAVSDITEDSIISKEDNGEEYKQVSCVSDHPSIGDATCFDFNTSTGTIEDYSNTPSCPKNLIIPSTINGVQVQIIGQYAFFGSNITSVEIPEGVVTISDFAFDSSKLTSVIIPDSVSSIGRYAFYENRLTSVDIPEGVSEIEDYSFTHNDLTSIDIPSTVTYIGEAAFNDNQLPDNEAFIYRRNYNGTEDFTTIVSYAGATRDNVEIPAGVTDIDEWSFAYNNLTSVDIPDSVEYIGSNAFRSNLLASIDLPDDLSYIGWRAFLSNQLTSLTTLPDNVSISGDAFLENHISTLVIPSTVTHIGEAAFNDNQLEDSDAFIYKRNSDGSIDNTILISYGGAKRSDVSIPNTVVTLDMDSFKWTDLISINIPNSVITIGNNSFGGNKLTSIDIPDSVVTIGGSAFNSNDLTSIVIPDSVTTIEYGAFEYNEITSIVFSSNMTSIPNYAFSSNSLTSVAIPGNIISIGNYAFAYNRITQGNATINNHATNVTLGSNVFASNGSSGGETIIPIFLLD